MIILLLWIALLFVILSMIPPLSSYPMLSIAVLLVVIYLLLGWVYPQRTVKTSALDVGVTPIMSLT